MSEEIEFLTVMQVGTEELGVSASTVGKLISGLLNGLNRQNRVVVYCTPMMS